MRKPQAREIISVSLDFDGTAVIIAPENGLEGNKKKYKYRVTGVNTIGNVTSHQNGIESYIILPIAFIMCINSCIYVDTSDVQSINVGLFMHQMLKVELIIYWSNISNSQSLGSSF